MATSQKKIDREYCLTDETVNCYGFRLLTSGYLIEEFKKNPIGYYMHDREDGVIVRWEDFRIDKEKVFAKPVINLSNERGQQTFDEAVDGFLNGASVGHIVALEYSEDPSMMVPGQTGPTITKWFNREASLVDVPGNFNSLALYDKDGNVINLADFKTQNFKPDMKQLILSAAVLAKVPGLKAESTQEEADTALANLIAEAAKVSDLTQQLADANAAKKTAEDALQSNNDAAVIALVDDAVAKTLCTKETGDHLKTQFKGKLADLKALLATMKPYTPVTGNLVATSSDAEKKELERLRNLSGEELFRNGGFDKLKALDKGTFKLKYKEYFGEEPKDE